MTLKRLRRRAGFHALQWISQIAAMGGYPRIQRWGHRLGLVHLKLSPGLRRKLKSQLTVLSEDTATPMLKDNIDDIIRSAVTLSDRAILEVMSLYNTERPATDCLPPITVDDQSHLETALADGQGAILLGMHMGNGLALAHQLNLSIAPIHVVYRESNKVTSGFFKKGIERLGLKAINAGSLDGGFRQMLKALKRNEIVMILMDQGTKRSGVDTRFLAKRVPMPMGPAELSRRSGAPIVPVWLEGAESGWFFRAKAPIACDPSAKIEDQVRNLTALMEAHILHFPELWSWHQRRWFKEPFDPCNLGAH